jgi:RNA polymerase sigma factor (sigma-70 family)
LRVTTADVRLSPSITILRTQSDERLVVLARGGSEAAFQAIVERYRRPLQRSCRRVLSESRAEDAVQQAFMSAWMALERGDEVLNLRGWLLMIARNTSLNALRVPGFDYSELRESLDVGAAPQEELERREVMRQTLAGLAALPERQREALLRSAVAGVSYSDIAHDLGLSEGATRQLVLRARTTMRAAATALVPWPLVQLLASGGRTDTTARIAEIVSASGGAGAAAFSAKAGVVAVVASSAVMAPAVVRHERDVVPRASAATRQAPAPAPTAAAVRSAPRRMVATSTPTTGSSAATRSSGAGGTRGSSGARESSGAKASRGTNGSSGATADRQRHPGNDTSDDHASSGPGPGGETADASEHRRGSRHDAVGEVGDHRADARRGDHNRGSGSGSGSEHAGSAGDRKGRGGHDDEPSGSQPPVRITTETAEPAESAGSAESGAGTGSSGSGGGSPASEESGSPSGTDGVPDPPKADK